MRRVIQITPALLFGDAVGNVVLTIDRLARQSGYETVICTGVVHPRLDVSELTLVDDLGGIGPDDVLIYHAASACDYVEAFAAAPGKKVLIYHNITPPSFFQGFDLNSAAFCREGLRQVRSLAASVDYALADSSFNRQDLIDMGYTCPIDVVPVLVKYQDFLETTPSQKVLDRYRHAEGSNVLYVGRIAPHKKIEDVIRAFDCFQRAYDSQARLFLVGNFNEADLYYRSLRDYVCQLGVRNVVFPGHIGFDEIVAYYKIADTLLLQSEHEGFCVPVLEGFAMDVPVLAYDAGAIAETMGGAGVLMNIKNVEYVAAALDVTVRADAHEVIIEKQRKRLDNFAYENVSKKLLASLQAILKD